MIDIPRKYKKLYEKAMNSKSRKAKIRFFCLECVGFSEIEVTLCTDKSCPFYDVRRGG